MNLVLDEAEEISLKKKQRKPIGLKSTNWGLFACETHCSLGRIMLKGDNITLMMRVKD